MDLRLAGSASEGLGPRALRKGISEMSENFLLSEFLHSDTAISCGVENLPSWEDVDRLAQLAEVLEQVRAILGAAIQVSSGFRCPAVNEAVGGVSDSAHLFGLACDFVAPEFGDVTDVVSALEPHLVELGIDQLIHEGTWIHLGLALPPALPRHECFAL
jgi:zinc D-Ala-D-Ala carboxypeptidase